MPFGGLGRRRRRGWRGLGACTRAARCTESSRRRRGGTALRAGGFLPAAPVAPAGCGMPLGLVFAQRAWAGALLVGQEEFYGVSCSPNKKKWIATLNMDEIHKDGS